MKKTLALMLALSICLGVLSSCGNSGGAGSSAGNSSSSGSEFEKVTIKLAHTAAESHIHHIAVEQFAQNVAERTGGAVTIDVYPAGELGDATTLVEQTSLGAIEMNIVAQSNIASYMTKANALAAPYLFTDYDHAHRVIDNYIFDWLNEDSVETMNSVVLAVFDYGFRQVTTKGIEVNTAADLKGVTIRVPPSAGLLAAFDALGANTTQIAYSELYQSLQQGVVDAQENPVATILADCLYEVQDNLAITNHYFDMQALIINADFWNGLSPELQTILQEEAIKASDTVREYLSSSESDIIKQLEEHGMNVTYPDQQSFIDMMEPAYTTMGELAGENEMADLLEAVESNR